MFIILNKKVNLGGGKFLLPGKAHQVTDELGNRLVARGAAMRVKAKTQYVATQKGVVDEADTD